MIELLNISKSYRVNGKTNRVLQNISFMFPTDKSIGILGLNGAGKSTLLRIIAGVELPDEGEVVKDCRVSWPIGFKGGFNASLSGEENCRFIARIYGQNVDRVTGFAYEFAELGRQFYDPIRTYSSGMKARLAFGLSMAIDFDVYMIDEVTAVGDKRFRDKCNALFKERRQRSTVIMVSHSMPTIREYCDCCAILARGSLQLYESVEDAEKVYEAL